MGSGIVIPEEDPLRTYTPGEEERLTRNLLGLISRIHEGQYSGRIFDRRFLEGFHRDIFSSIRNHAGRSRAPGQGSEHVVFGPHRSFSRDEVPQALARIFDELSKALTSLEGNPEHPDFDAVALRTAAWAHAEIIRVHPFEDGNGRASRALMSAILVRLGLRPIAVEAPKQEYLGLLNHYYETGDLQPFVDLCIRLYPDVG